MAALLALFPKEMVLALAGLALLPTIGSGLATAVRDDRQREAAIVTFLVTASGVTLANIGSAFWGLVAGVATLMILHAGRKRPAPAEEEGAAVHEGGPGEGDEARIMQTPGGGDMDVVEPTLVEPEAD